MRAEFWPDWLRGLPWLPIALLAACVVFFSGAVRLYHRTSYSLGLSKGSSEMHGVAEASELAYFGAKVLHPSTILPAVAKNIISGRSGDMDLCPVIQ